MFRGDPISNNLRVLIRRAKYRDRHRDRHEHTQAETGVMLPQAKETQGAIRMWKKQVRILPYSLLGNVARSTLWFQTCGAKNGRE